jgi:hypothetical protein
MLETARADARKIVSDPAGATSEMTFVSEGGAHTAVIWGLDAVTHYNYSEAMTVNTQNGRVTISEQELVDKGYPTRDARGDINLTGGTVSLADANGTIRRYLIEQAHPDNTLGMVTLIVGNTKVVG